MKLSLEQAHDVVKIIKDKKEYYNPDKHPALLLMIMSDPEKSRMTAFCEYVGIGERTFYNWVKKCDLFRDCFELGKILSRENWEKEGLQIREEINMPGTISNKFEHWKMVGWSRFGIGKTNKLRLDLNPDDKPTAHYAQLIRQANSGEFTASEIKQLMEALSLGLKTQQTVDMQEEIDCLKSDLIKMTENRNGHNSVPNQRIEKEDKYRVENSVC